MRVQSHHSWEVEPRDSLEACGTASLGCAEPASLYAVSSVSMLTYTNMHDTHT